MINAIQINETGTPLSPILKIKNKKSYKYEQVYLYKVLMMNFISSEIFIVEFFQFDTSLGITEKRLEKLKFGTIARDF